MGLAASQARFLGLTARKTNIEYQGQQINEQRLLLANKSASLYNQMLVLEVPTPPSQANFTTVKYAYTAKDSAGNTRSYEINEADLQVALDGLTDTNKKEGTNGDYLYSTTASVTGKYKDANGNQQSTAFYVATCSKVKTENGTLNVTVDPVSGRITNVWLSATSDFGTKVGSGDAAAIDTEYQNGMIQLTANEQIDQQAYDDAYNQYKYEQYLYEQEIEQINASTEIIQQQDKTLELQLKQLDTEQSALKNELEALDKVVGDAVESGFKTFGG